MTETELRELGLPDVFLAIAAGTAPIEVSASCLPIGEFLAMQPDLSRRFPPAASYVPLWVLNAFGVIAFDLQRRAYVQYYIGDSDDKIIARDYEELCAFLFLELIDSGLWDELDELAPLFRFPHVAELKAYCERNPGGTADEVARNFVRIIRRTAAQE